MRNQKYEKVIGMWGYSCQNGYDGPDWVDVDSYAVLCVDSHNNYHLYLEGIYDEKNQTVHASFDIGFNPVFFITGIDDCMEELIQEYVLIFELLLHDKNNWYDELDELDQLEVKIDLLKHMRSAIKDRNNYILDDVTMESGFPFRLWFGKTNIE